ncbi:MAG TPA: aminoacyl-tRNA hydrolase [Patescibacteria group bacterium]|nr:aminoacyl-tRNA hydrolase [Patescibacteria group bacterium]
MKLVVALGNPGIEYLNTRHSVGFLVIDELQKAKFSKDVVLRKSDVFMNESGDFVKKLVDQYKLNPENLYVIHDDLDIRLGEYKIQLGHSPKDHNGTKSVDESLGTDKYWHVKIGIDNRPLDQRPLGVEYVLQNFTDEERKTVEAAIKKAVNELCKKLVT